ncbi:hypothetical protein GCM10027059_20740 [Myceligenerans halotolerans]
MFAAWGDESGSDKNLDPGAYMLGTAIVDPARADEIRDATRALRLKGQRKVHWRDDSLGRVTPVGSRRSNDRPRSA